MTAKPMTRSPMTRNGLPLAAARCLSGAVLAFSLFGAADPPPAGSGRAGGGTTAATALAEPALVVYGLDSSVPFSSPRGIAISAERGEVYLANTGSGRIDIFDLRGRPKARFMHRVATPAGTYVDGQPRGIAVDRAGRLYVVDNMASYVDVLDFRGRSVARLEPEGGWQGAGAVAVAPNGMIFVAVRGDSGKVYSFGQDFKPRGSWGIAGKAPGELTQLSGIAAGPDGRVVVTSIGADQAVQIFDAQGAYLGGFGRHDVGQDNFSFPSAVAVSADGRIWVTDEIRQVIKVFASSGAFLGMIGGLGAGPGDFKYPSAVASDGGKWLAVAEREGGRFQLMTIR
ncbi:MAG: NHL repeat-containing protein [Candidatus Eisenbacteria bacterium]|nr:NHL repeat-containing protein [Candidatus Eisenbacteria bacterium]